MILAINKKTNKTQTFTEKDWKDIQFHFPKEWEQIEIESVEATNESDLIIEVVKPKEFIKEQPKKRGRSKK